MKNRFSIKRTIKWITIFIVLIFLVFFLVQFLNWWVLAVISEVDPEKYKDVGVIGDTIGGLTSPIIGIVSSVLVFIAFMAQLEANNMQFSLIKEEKVKLRRERWYNLRLTQLNEFKHSFSDIHFRYPESDDVNDFFSSKFSSLKGHTAVSIFSIEMDDFNFLTPTKKMCLIYFLYEYNSLIKEFQMLLNTIQHQNNYYTAESSAVMEYCRIFYAINIKPGALLVIASLKDHPEKKEQLEKDIDQINSILFDEDNFKGFWLNNNV